ncbi:hypothetical protein [Actinoplanes sp. NPDC026670]|uniref:hypothetical protein n=1 Tax=Actinoplanes sp. NPDC026670 TaxID=3154700 RepID=UPI0033C3200E
MRFFSNEAQDNVDDKKDHHDDPDATAPVPQQRPGSPWQHDTATSASADDPDRTVAFSDGTDPAPKHSLPDDTAPKHKLPDSDDKINFKETDDGVRPDDATVDSTPDDRDTVDDPHLKDADLDSKLDSKKDSDSTEDVEFKDADPDTDADFKKTGSDLTDSGAGFDPAEPEPVKDKADTIDETDPTPDPVVASAAEPAATPVVAPAETPAASGPLPFFPAADTQPLRDRWRDVQLRFVDDPKGATADAAGLVDEAVDKLSSAVRDHKGSFAKGTDDTEALRVELRSYRDILDRLLGL